MQLKAERTHYFVLHPLGMGQTLAEVARLVRQHWFLILNLTRREITDRYAGQVLGAFWAIGHPLFLVLVYVFIFGVIFKARLEVADIPRNYTIYIVSGLLPWLAFIEGLTKNSTAISGNASLVKQVVFPVETLVIRSVLSSLVPQIIGTMFILLYTLLVTGSLPWTVVLWPGLLFFELLLMTGLGFAISSIGAYFRDLKDFIQLFSIAGLYAMPVVYLPGWAPFPFNILLNLNPFSYIIWGFQDALFFGRFEHPLAWVIFPLLSVLALIIGYRTFKRLKIYFANVL